MVDSLPLPPPQVPLTRPDGSGKNTQQGFEFLDRLQRLAKTLAQVTNVFDNMNSAAADAFLQTLLNDNYETIGKFVGINTQTASYQLVLADVGKLVEMNVAGANNLTIPTNATIAFPIGTYINVTQLGAGQTTIVGAGGVTLSAYNSGFKLSGQHACGTLHKRATDSWVASGNLTP